MLEFPKFDWANAYANSETIKVPLHGWPRLFDCNKRSDAVLDDPEAALYERQMFKGRVLRLVHRSRDLPSTVAMSINAEDGGHEVGAFYWRASQQLEIV
jgi:hypothetical protein